MKTSATPQTSYGYLWAWSISAIIPLIPTKPVFHSMKSRGGRRGGNERRSLWGIQKPAASIDSFSLKIVQCREGFCNLSLWRFVHLKFLDLTAGSIPGWMKWGAHLSDVRWSEQSRSPPSNGSLWGEEAGKLKTFSGFLRNVLAFKSDLRYKVFFMGYVGYFEAHAKWINIWMSR